MPKLSVVSIIIPTWNNPEYLFPCIQSILATRTSYPLHIILVNNGHPSSISGLRHNPDVTVVQAQENLGWEGGLKLGLQHTTSPFVMFANDDIFIPRSSTNWLRSMMARFSDPLVGAVGPSSNCVMGSQNIWSPNSAYESIYTTFLVGFCVLLRRSALDAAGGVDDTLPGGDDIDLSIRLRYAAKKNLLIDKTVFVYHHGFKTGERIRGDASQVGGWNSQEMTDATNTALIRKHGFRRWYEALYYRPHGAVGSGSDIEGEVVRSLVGDAKDVLELGCGGQKTVADAVGLDIVKNGEIIPTIGKTSVADIVADAEAIPHGVGQFDAIIARHLLEHCVNPLAAIQGWGRHLRDGGSLVIAVPDDKLVDSIPLNPEHKHSFSQDYLAALCSAVGLTPTKAVEPGNGISFILVAKKAPQTAEPASSDEAREAVETLG